MADAVDVPPTQVTLDIPVDDCTKRSFTVVEVRQFGKDGDLVPIDGKRRYLSNNPAGATKKASTRIIRELFGENDDNCVVYVVMQETTKGSKKNAYRYTATRSISTKKREIAFGGGGKSESPIGFRYDIRLKSERDVASRGAAGSASAAADGAASLST